QFSDRLFHQSKLLLVPGLKYLHSARILHRDIKPGNLLVNSNCVLKICDFGLARVEEPDQNKHMTQEVVTQYYRAPEILMGARHYTAAVDVWSVGCIFGELLRRRILFQAQSPVQQLELITELLGTPTLEDMRFACEGARSHMLRRAPKPPSLTALYTLSSQATHEAVHLLCQMLVFDPDKRITVVDALAHPYLDEGRLRYHSCMCACCYTTSGGLRQYTGDFEPATSHPFDDLWERKLTTVQQVKESRSPTQRSTPRIRTRYYHYQYRISYLPLLSATIDYYRYRLPLLLLPLLPLLLPLLLLLP
ncbi:unnamed protein product, partial [Heterotrigona itama]